MKVTPFKKFKVIVIPEFSKLKLEKDPKSIIEKDTKWTFVIKHYKSHTHLPNNDNPIDGYLWTMLFDDHSHAQSTCLFKTAEDCEDDIKTFIEEMNFKHLIYVKEDVNKNFKQIPLINGN